jgi:hypothetical protein
MSESELVATLAAFNRKRLQGVIPDILKGSDRFRKVKDKWWLKGDARATLRPKDNAKPQKVRRPRAKTPVGKQTMPTGKKPRPGGGSVITLEDQKRPPKKGPQKRPGRRGYASIQRARDGKIGRAKLRG